MILGVLPLLINLLAASDSASEQHEPLTGCPASSDVAGTWTGPSVCVCVCV